MCGIAGAYHLFEPREPDAAVLESAIGDIAFRGPDDSGVWTSPGIGLAHRRLSIIDLNGGHQPMHSADGRFVTIFNGEIYNFKALRADLAGKGHRFKSQSDTEVLLAAYGAWGVDCIRRLRGMFAFALFDTKSRKLILCRDRLGIKPLYVAESSDGSVGFASSAEVAARLAGIPIRPNICALSDYLSYRQPLGEDSTLNNVRTVPPGSYYEYCDGKVRHATYWQLPKLQNEQDLGARHYAIGLRKRLNEAVRLHMISDVPVGAFLSGGLDSSIIATLMTHHSRSPIHTYCIGFGGDGFSELRESRSLARKIGTVHHEIMLSPKEYFDLLPLLINRTGMPLSVPNEVAIFKMSLQLRKHHAVVLSGEGADELFGGYGRILRLPFELLKRRLLSQDPTTNSAEQPSSLCDAFVNSYSLLKPRPKLALWHRDLAQGMSRDPLNARYFRALFDSLPHLNEYAKLLWVFETVHLRNLLRRLDTATMAASVEGRVPFADHEVVEYAFHIPVQHKLHWRDPSAPLKALSMLPGEYSEVLDSTKHILRSSFAAALPKEVIFRRKIGFPVPLTRWLGHRFTDFAREILLDRACLSRGIFSRNGLGQAIANTTSARADSNAGTHLWMLINVELWLRTLNNRPIGASVWGDRNARNNSRRRKR